MLTTRLVHEHDCTPDDFWQVFFDAEIQARQFLEVMHFHAWRVERFEPNDDGHHRVLFATPRIDGVPGPLKAIVGDGFSYREDGVFRKSASVFDFNVIPSKLADRMTIRGSLHCVAVGDARCRRTTDFSVEARVFGVGGLLERRILADIEKNYAASAAHLDAVIRQRPR